MPTRCSGFFYVSTVKQRDVARRSKRSRYGDASDTEEKCSHRIAWTARIPVIRMKRARSYRERDSGIRSKIQLLVQRVSRAGISQVERLWKYLPRSRVSARWRFGSADARKYHHGLLAGLVQNNSRISSGERPNGRQRHHHRWLRVHRLGYFELRDDSSEHRLRRGVHPWTRKRRLRYGGQRQRFGKCLCTLDAAGAIPRNEG